MEEKIKNLMQKLKITREEAMEIIADDERVEHGEKLFELTDEQKKTAKKMAATGTRTIKQPVKRERKVDEDKKMLMEGFIAFLEKAGAVVAPMETEAAVKFSYNSGEYTLKIVRHRPPKK